MSAEWAIVRRSVALVWRMLLTSSRTSAEAGALHSNLRRDGYEWHEDKVSRVELRHGGALPPSSDVRHQNATQRRRHATTELASVERCSRENALETPLHADKPHGGEGATDGEFWL
jgi:hypothetical protein